MEVKLLVCCEIILDIYGFYQSVKEIVAMTNKRFMKSTTYKFLILCCIVNIFDYLVNFSLMTWHLFDPNVESCFYFAIGFFFTDLSNVWSLFGISALRFISVVKKKLFTSQDCLWKFMFPIFLAITLTLVFTIYESETNGLQQVRIKFQSQF